MNAEHQNENIKIEMIEPNLCNYCNQAEIIEDSGDLCLKCYLGGEPCIQCGENKGENDYNGYCKSCYNNQIDEVEGDNSPTPDEISIDDITKVRTKKSNEPEHESEKFIFNLPYHNTKWGLFYATYKDCNQLKLSKYLTHTRKFMRESREKTQNYTNKFENQKFCQKVFYETELARVDVNSDKKTYITPKMLLAEYNKFFDDKYAKDLKQIILAYRNRQNKEFDEVLTYFKQKQAELKILQSANRKERAKQKVNCPHCNVEMTRTNVSRHQKFNLKCRDIKMKQMLQQEKEHLALQNEDK
jgi:hypothetical protein